MEQWEKEFEKEFSSRVTPYPTTADRILEWQTERDKSIKSFISSLVAKEKAKQKEDIREKIIKEVPRHTEIGDLVSRPEILSLLD